MIIATTDGSPLPAVRSLLPDDHPRVVAVETDEGLYVDLAPGITETQIAEGWRDISEGGFDEIPPRP